MKIRRAPYAGASDFAKSYAGQAEGQAVITCHPVFAKATTGKHLLSRLRQGYDGQAPVISCYHLYITYASAIRQLVISF